MKKEQKNPLIFWLILTLFTVIIILEYITPADYVFGYLYIAPIVLAIYGLSERMTLTFTLVALAMTLLNLIFPQLKFQPMSTVINRLVVVLALVITGWLVRKIRHYEEEINHQKIQLEAAEKLVILREDFVFTLTHDLKTPLLGAIQTLKGFENGLFGDISHQQKKVLEMMLRSHDSSLKLVETLLDIYRHDTEGIKLKWESLNLAAIAADVIASLTDLASSRQVYLVLNYGESDFHKHFWSKGDSLQIQRVFTNLIINGINHSLRGGKVEVQLENDGEFQQVKITDQGLGITPSELPYLFQRFYQGGGNRQAQGTGLGLYLTRQIIEAHGGKIWVETPTVGAIFIFRLKAFNEPISI